MTIGNYQLQPQPPSWCPPQHPSPWPSPCPSPWQPPPWHPPSPCPSPWQPPSPHPPSSWHPPPHPPQPPSCPCPWHPPHPLVWRYSPCRPSLSSFSVASLTLMISPLKFNVLPAISELRSILTMSAETSSTMPGMTAPMLLSIGILVPGTSRSSRISPFTSNAD